MRYVVTTIRVSLIVSLFCLTHNYKKATSHLDMQAGMNLNKVIVGIVLCPSHEVHGFYNEGDYSAH